MKLKYYYLNIKFLILINVHFLKKFKEIYFITIIFFLIKNFKKLLINSIFFFNY